MRMRPRIHADTLTLERARLRAGVDGVNEVEEWREMWITEIKEEGKGEKESCKL